MDEYLTVGHWKGSDRWTGLHYRNRPTPSGCTRYILQTSTTQDFATAEQASREIESGFPHLPVVEDGDVSGDETGDSGT